MMSVLPACSVCFSFRTAICPVMSEEQWRLQYLTATISAHELVTPQELDHFPCEFAWMTSEIFLNSYFFFFFWVLFQFYWVFWLFPVICFLVCVCVNKLMRRLMSKCNWYGTTRYLLINSMLVNIKPCSLLCLSLFSFLYAEKPLIDRSQEALLRCKLI